MADLSAEQARLAKGTGISWERWLQIFAGHDASNHTALAVVATKAIEAEGSTENAAWWGQSAAIVYEHTVGARVAGQQCDGTFAASLNRTVAAPVAELHEAFIAFMADRTSFDGIDFAAAATTSVTPKRSYWRVKLADGSKLEVAFAPAKEKTQISLTRNQMSDGSTKDAVKASLLELVQEFISTRNPS